MAASLKILVDVRMVSPQVHGIGRYTVDLIHGLNELGQEISVIACDKRQVEYLGPTSIKDIHVCPVRFASPGESFALSKISQAEKYDVIHFPSFAVPLFAPWKNVVVTIHDLIHLHEKKPLHQIYYKTVVAPALKKAKKVITVSEWTKNDLHKKLNVTLDKVSVVRNGLEPGWFSGDRSVTKNEEVYFISLANLKNHKNISTLVKAAKDLWNEGLDFKLYLSLSGEEIPSAWGLTDLEKSKIKTFKNLSDLEVRGLILNSKALISTSRFEGFNYPVAEALALGKTAIISRGSANDELKGNRLIFYGTFDDSEALKKSMKDVLHGSETSTPSHSVYSRLQMAQKTLDVYLS